MNEEEIIEKVKELEENCECWLGDKNTPEEEKEWFRMEKTTIQGLLDLYNHKKEVLQLTQSGLDEAKVVIQMMVEEIMIKRCYTYVSPEQWNSLKQEIIDGYFKNVGEVKHE